MSKQLATSILLAITFCASSSGQSSAASFDGNGTGWVEVADSPTLVPATGITVEAWVYRINSGSHRAVVRKNSGFLNESYNLRMTGTSPEWIIKTQANGTLQLGTSTQIPANSWHHLAGTFDNSVARVYLDGVQIGQSSTLTGPLLNTGSTLKIGNGDSEPWSGLIDAVRIWSVARTQQQIQATMNFQINVAPGLVSSWHLDNNFLDSTGSNHGVQMGTVPFVPGAPLIGNLQAPVNSPIGGPLPFQINNQAPSLPYVLDVSITGSSPGVTVAPGVVLPLNPPWLNWETGAALTNTFVNFFGLLDANGHAYPYVVVPGDPALVGIVVSATYVTFTASSPPSLQFVASASHTTLIGFAPAVMTVTPAIGVTTGGTSILIAGNHFQTGATVLIGTMAATNVVVASPTQVTCVTPPGTLGPKSVTVTNPDGSGTTVANLFTYVAPLVLSQVSPAVAPAGAAVVITGNGIQAGASVLAGGIQVTPTSLTGSQITFSNPSGLPCNTVVQVTNPDGQVATLPFNPSPSVLFTSPSSGPAAGGNVVTILGTNFYPGTGITVNGAAVTPTSITPGQISFVIPAGAPGPVPVVLTSVTGCSATLTYTYL